MKRILFLMCLILALAICALAQEQAATDKLEAKRLTPAQTQQLIEANKMLIQIQTEVELAKQRLATVQAQNQAMIRGFFIELGLDGKKYAVKLEVIDPKTDSVGFLPIPEPVKDAKKDAKPEENKQ